MTNTTAQWEQAILNKLTSNGERIAVVESKLDNIENRLDNLENRLDNIENRLENIEDSLGDLKTTNQKIESLLGWLKWIGGSVIAIALSLIANFVYSLIA